MFRGLLFIFILLYSFTGINQTSEYTFDHLSLSDGLSNTFTTDILKDSKGYVWIGTQNGLNRYNAYDVEVFQHDPDNNSSISSSNIQALYEDHSGNIWIGTTNGLNLFNRETKSFKNFIPNTDSLHFSPRIILSIIEDHNETLWLGTAGQSLVKFSLEHHNFEKINLQPPTNQKNINTIQVNDLIIDKNNNLWIGFNGGGIVKINIDTEETAYYHPNIAQNPVELLFCFSLFEDNNGTIWAGTFVGGLLKYNTKKGVFENIQNPYNKNEKTKNGIMSIHQNSRGNLLLGSNGGGLFIFDPINATFLANYSLEPGNTNSLSDNFIIKIYIDNNDIIWLGTENGGISIFNPHESKFRTYTRMGNNPWDLPDNVINTIYEDDSGYVWVGSENNGFSKLDKSTMRYENFRIPNVQFNTSSVFVKSIINDNNGGVWAGGSMAGLSQVTSSGVILNQYANSLQTDQSDALPDHDVRTLTLDKNGTLWIGSHNGFFEMKENGFISHCTQPISDQGICYEIINYIFEYDSDHLLICFEHHGMAFFNKNNKQFGSIFKSNNASNGLSSNTVNYAMRDSKNQVWISTSNGIHLFNPADSSFQSFHKKDGLSDNITFGILEDENNLLWISTANGLSSFNSETKSFHNYYKEDGLSSNVFRKGAFFKSQSGELYFGGVNGFNSFYPTSLVNNPLPPKIILTDFQVFNKTVTPGKNAAIKTSIESVSTIELNYKETFSLEFAALNYTITEKNEYAYKLIGFDNDWNYIGTRRFISFTNIPAGEYILQIKASNNDGVWNEDGISINIIIHPPFWQTWWFRTLMALLFVGTLYFWYKKRVKAIEKYSKDLEQQVKVRTLKIVEQKDEIALQKIIVEEKNKDMVDSILYSKRIQDSFLPNLSDFHSNFNDSFVFFKPKDIVSGDFYWMENITSNQEDVILFAVGDCTGHGVPGAMVSVLGYNGLRRAITEFNLTQPNEILDSLNNYVKQSFDRSDDNIRDGMDIALCSLNLNTKQLLYSGANNPLWIIRDHNIIEVKADKQPIGNYHASKPFNATSLLLAPNDWVILFSDGFPDQFGGLKNKKYKYSNLKKLLIELSLQPGTKFEAKLDSEFMTWKGDEEQVDDICIVGVKI